MPQKPEEATPQQAVIDRLGGVAELARKLALHTGISYARSTVQGWYDSGLIPTKHQQNVLNVGAMLTPPIVASDLFEDGL